MERKFINLMSIAIKLFKERKGKLPIICIFGHNDFELVTPTGEDYEETRLDCRCYSSDSNLEQVLIKDRPQVIITIGNLPSFPNLIKAPFQIRKRWLHYDTLPDLTQLGIDAYNCYLTNLFSDQGADDNPLVTVFTPAYKTGEKSIGHSYPSSNRPIPIGNG